MDFPRRFESLPQGPQRGRAPAGHRDFPALPGECVPPFRRWDLDHQLGQSQSGRAQGRLGRPQLHPRLIDFARHYGTTILPCLPRVPEHKGKVESGVKYVKNNALAGSKFAALAEVNAFLLHWEKTVADVRIHGTTKRRVAELFKLEKPFLTPLPASLFPCFQEAPRSVHRDGHVEVAKAYYHVPPEYLRRDVWVRFDSREVRIFIQDKVGALKQIQIHRRLQPGQFTNARGIGGGQGSLQANMDYWLKRACNLGFSCEQWARCGRQSWHWGSARVDGVGRFTAKTVG